MTPHLPIGLGLATIALGILLLRSYGPRARLGRLLAGDDRRRPLVAAGAMGAWLLLLAVGLGWALPARGFA